MSIDQIFQDDPLEKYGLNRNSLADLRQAIEEYEKKFFVEEANEIRGAVADQVLIAIFIETLFKHATDGHVQLRAFTDDDARESFPRFPFPAYQITDKQALIEAATQAAGNAAMSDKRVNFCPPVATFLGKVRATNEELCQGLVIVAECDEKPVEARQRLEALLGPPTMVIKSGGIWRDPTSGQEHDKCHLYWRLNTPTIIPTDHKKLRDARSLAAGLVSSDPSAKPSVHPLRMPGSWHKKVTPRLCYIDDINPDAEVDLDVVLPILRAAALEAGVRLPEDKPKVDAADLNLKRDNGLWDVQRDSGHIVDAYLALADGQHPALFSTAVSIAMSAINHGYEISASELYDIARELHEKNPPRNKPYKVDGRGDELANLANKALQHAIDHAGSDPAYKRTWDYKIYQQWQRDMEEEQREGDDDNPGEAGPDDPTWEPPDEEPIKDSASACGEQQTTSPLEPFDLFGNLTPEPVIRRDMLPDKIADYCWEQSELLGCDPGAMSVAALVMCSGLIHDHVKLMPKRHDTTYLECARLWLILIAEVSRKKTPMLLKLTTVIKQIEYRMRLEDDLAMEEYRQAMAVYEKKRKGWSDEAAKTGQAPGDSGPEKPEKPRRRRILTNEFTVESLAPILCDNPRGLYFDLDEIMSLFGGFDAYKAAGVNKDRSAVLQLWNGGPRAIDRVRTTDDPINVPNWAGAISGGIQPAVLDKIGPKLVDDGMLQRFMLVPLDVANDEADRPPNADIISTFQMLVQNLVSYEPGPVVVRLSEEAHEFRLRIEQLLQALAVLPGFNVGFCGHALKLIAIYHRLTLTMHVIEHAHWFNWQDDGFTVVNGATAERAYNLIVEFLIPHAVRQYERINDTAGNQLCQDVGWMAGHILARKLTVADKRVCHDAYRPFKKNPKRADAVLIALRDAHWLNNKCEVNPRVHELYAERGEQERRQRDEKIERIKRANNRVNKTYKKNTD